MLRHNPKPPREIPGELTFQEFDLKSGEACFSAVLRTATADILFPESPNRIMIEFSGEPAPDEIMGAVVAKAIKMALQYDRPTRIFTPCAPQDQTMMETLASLGFKNDDKLIRMQTRLPLRNPRREQPKFQILEDELTDESEQRAFLNRYNQLYDCEKNLQWLKSYARRDYFRRFRVHSAKGLVGEMTCWQDGDVGFIGYIFIKKQYRCRGIGSALVVRACEYFYESGFDDAAVNVQTSITGIRNLFTSVGFTNRGTLVRYPGLYIYPNEEA